MAVIRTMEGEPVTVTCEVCVVVDLTVLVDVFIVWWTTVVVGTEIFKHEQAIDNWAAGYSFAPFGVKIGALRSFRSLSRFSIAAIGGFPGLKTVLVLCSLIS